MDRRQTAYFTIGFGILLLVVVLLLAWGGRRESVGIVLPAAQADTGGMEGNGGESRLNLVEITPETVKPAINTLSRPISYSRVQVVETFWSGGSGQSVSQVYVSGSRTRLDTQLPDGSVRHTLVSGDSAGVWYDDETEWAALGAGPLAADQSARMPTYETVRDLPASSIAAADYRTLDGLSCIYVETRPDGEGYADFYWVSVDSGLLCRAERTRHGALVYRFTGDTPETASPDESLFLLPDGTALPAA